MVNVDIPDLKSLRETLCVAMSAIGHTYVPNQTSYGMYHISMLQELTDMIDKLRPLGPDGKHGNRHTEFCGCEIIWRAIPDFDGFEASNKGHLRESDEFVWYAPKFTTPEGEHYYELYNNGSVILLSSYELVRMTFPDLYKE